jgi:AcrR family transcriptional regulator
MAKQKVDEATIIKESLKLFRRKSYHTTSMSDIANACGLLKGSLYHYFASKEELMLKVIASVHQFFKQEVFAHAYNTDIEPIERFQLMLNRSEKIFIDKETGQIEGNIGVETALAIPEFQPVIQEFFRDFFDAIKTIYATKYSDDIANELAERAVAEVEGAIMLSRVFNDKNYLLNTHKRLLTRLEVQGARLKV